MHASDRLVSKDTWESSVWHMEGKKKVDDIRLKLWLENNQLLIFKLHSKPESWGKLIKTIAKFGKSVRVFCLALNKRHLHTSSHYRKCCPICRRLKATPWRICWVRSCLHTGICRHSCPNTCNRCLITGNSSQGYTIWRKYNNYSIPIDSTHNSSHIVWSNNPKDWIISVRMLDH